MPFTIVAWTESQDTSNALTLVAALQDQHITTEGDDILVPDWAPNLAAILAVGATITQARIDSPSLRKESLVHVYPINVGAEPLAPTPYMGMWKRPRILETGEGLRALVAENAAGAERETVIAWLQGEASTMPEGVIETVRLDFTATLTAFEWTLASGTLAQQLRSGRYTIVGMRAESAGLVAARLVIPGSQYRPGVVGYDAAQDVEDSRFRMGGLDQSWGEFENRFVPQVEFLSASADTSETVWLDVIKLP